MEKEAHLSQHNKAHEAAANLVDNSKSSSPSRPQHLRQNHQTDDPDEPLSSSSQTEVANYVQYERLNDKGGQND